MEPLRGALVGCGMISQHHLRAWARVPNVAIVALCDHREDVARARAAEFGLRARVYRDLRRLLADEALDFVDIATPPAAHVEQCTWALEAGCHVSCQKPLAFAAEEAKSLGGLAHRAGRLLAVHENHRFRPWFQDLVTHHRAGDFGRIVRLRLQQWDPQPPPELYKRQAQRGVLFEYGSHLIDMMLVLLGAPARAFAQVHRLTSEVAGESAAHAVFHYPAASVDIDVAWKTMGPASGGLSLLGDHGEGHYEGTMTRGPSSRFAVNLQGHVVREETRNPTADYGESFFHHNRVFAEAVRSHAQGQPHHGHLVTADEAARVLACLEAAYDSARLARSVPL